jgi:hypothetical protein
MNKKVIHVICMILIVGVILYVYYSSYTEGLEEEVVQGPFRCGVDLPSCSGEHVRCINGYCRSDVATTLPSFSDLRMTPPTSY